MNEPRPTSTDIPAEADAELDAYAEQLPQVPRDPSAEPGDPPPFIRGASQGLSDPPGDPADDGSKRWDPRTAATDQREGG